MGGLVYRYIRRGDKAISAICVEPTRQTRLKIAHSTADVYHGTADVFDACTWHGRHVVQNSD